MFAKRLLNADLSKSVLFGCCSCFGPSASSSSSSKPTESGGHGKTPGPKDSGGHHGQQGSEDRGTAYNYTSESSSGDSDDEVLEHYKKIRRSDTSQSVRSPKGTKPLPSLDFSHNKSHRTMKSPSECVTLVHEDYPTADDNQTKEKTTTITDDDKQSVVSGKKSVSSVSPRDQDGIQGAGTEGQTGSRPTSPGVASQGSVSPKGSQTHHIFDNQAYGGDGVSTASEQLSVTGGMSTDEHLFDVSDLQKDPPLISKCGNLEMTFSYDPNKGRMAITVHQAQDIPSKERGGASNTQVRLLLLPTKKQRCKTKAKTGDNPMFMESFVFTKIPPEEVHGMGVRIRLYGLERMRRERMIGESIIGFASLNLEMACTHWVILEPRSNLSAGDSRFDVSSLSRSDSASSTHSMQHGGMPELLLGLAYNGTTGRLSVEVIKGSSFRNMAMNRAPDTYVKLTLMSPTGEEVARSKTSVRRGQPNPLFKETFMFQVALFQLAEVTLMVSVYNKRGMKKKDMIGWFSLGLKSSGEEEQSHWQDMRESKGDQVCRWHVLLES